MGNGSGLTITEEEANSGASSASSGNSLNGSSDTGQNLQAAESLLTMEIYDANSLLRKLQLRGVNPLRPEILAIIEFLPLAIDDQNLNSSFSNINFGSDAIQNNITSAANFAEIQRVLKDMNYRAVVSLIEKESGMKLDLMKSIIDLFVLILNRTASESLNSIFLAGSNVDDAAQLLVSQYFSDNLILNSSNDITQKESIIINNQTFFRSERLSINNKLNFLDDLETVRLRQFLETNISNPRILLLARCAILSAISSGVIRHLKSNTSFVDDFIRAVSFIEVVNPDLEMSNSITKYGSFIKDQSYDLSENPLGKIGIATTTRGGDNHSLSMSNNFIFLNIIGGLVCEMLFFNDKDETLPENFININSILNKDFIRIGRSVEFYMAISDLSDLTYLQILDSGNTFSGNVDNISSSLTGNIKNYSDELFSFCIFNEVVGDNVFIKGKDIVSNFKNYINASQDLIQNDSKERLLSQFIHQILLKFSSTGVGYPNYVSVLSVGSRILNFQDTEELFEENNLGLLANRYVSYRNEKNGVNGTETGNKYLPLETSRGIYDFDLSQETANLIPVEDAFFNNNTNNEDFNSTNADGIFLDATTFSLLYNNDIKKLLEDVIDLFGLGYELNEGTIQDIAEDSKNNKIIVPGVTPVNYLNYYLEGIAKDLEDFLNGLQDFMISSHTGEGYVKGHLGEQPPEKEGNNRKHIKVRGQILSLAMILNSETDNDFLNLFRGFYFCDRTIKDHLRLPKLNLGSSNSSFDDEDLVTQYSQNATAGTDYCFGKLFNSLNHNGTLRMSGINFSVSANNGGWSSYIYHQDGFYDDVYDVDTAQIEREGKVLGYDDNQNILLENGTAEFRYIKSKRTLAPYKYIRPALAYGFRGYGEDYDFDNPKACIQLGGSFYQRLVNTPILYTKVNDHSGTADGDCSNAINAGGLTKSNYKKNRFTKARYYSENNNNLLQEIDSPDRFEYGGISNITHLQKCYAIFIWYVKFLKNTIGIKMKTDHEIGFFTVSQEFSFVFSTNQILGVIYALRGVSRENLNTQAQQFNISAADPTGIDIDLITQSYDNAMEQLSGIRTAIKRKKQQMLTKLNILAHNALDIQKETQDVINLIKNPQTLQGYEGYINKFFKDYSKNFTLSRDAIGNSTKYYYDHLNYSSESFPYPNYDKKQLNAFKRMYQTLSSKGYNLLENEKRGRKNILNIGIPSGLVDTLSQQAFSKSGDSHYLDSTLVAIYLHRTNELTEEEEVYPRPFVFDTAKYISNINVSENSNLLIPEFLKINELEEGKFTNDQNLLSIIENTKFLMSDRNRPNDQKLNFIDNGYGQQSMNYSLIDGITTEGNNYNNHFIKDVCINHVFDNYLKIYQNLLLNLEMENYNFLLDENAVYAGGLDNSEYVASCRESFKNFLLAYYPSYNVDPLTKNKVAQALSNYDNLFFNNTEEKIKQVVGGFVFDRVFSIPYSDRDFILKTQDYEGLYGSKIPLVKISSEQQIIDVLNYNNDNDIVAKNYSIKIKDNNVGTIYKFFATINILKRW